MKKTLKTFFKSKKFVSVCLPIALIIILGIIGYFSFSSSDDSINETEATIKSERFINDFLMDDGAARVTSIAKEYGLYKLTIDIGSGDPVESYISKDGKLFFPQTLNIDDIYSQNDTSATSATEAVTEVDVKSDKPTVELFVMSHCPYGTQMEKAILPAIDALGDSIDFEIKFNSYAMHGAPELNEEMFQYCLAQEEPAIYLDYLNCFLVDGDEDRCISEMNIDKDSLNSCITGIDEEFKITENFEANNYSTYPDFPVSQTDNEKYGVQGSPTLVINGQTISANRNPAALLNVICSAFTTTPEACSAILTSDSPAAGFGVETTSASNSAAACN